MYYLINSVIVVKKWHHSLLNWAKPAAVQSWISCHSLTQSSTNNGNLCQTAHLSWCMTLTHLCTNTYTNTNTSAADTQAAGGEWQRQEGMHSIGPSSSWLAGWGKNWRQRGLCHWKNPLQTPQKRIERGGVSRKRKRIRNDVRNCVPIRVKVLLPPTLCLCAALCQ